MGPRSSAPAAEAAPPRRTPAGRVARDLRRATRERHSAGGETRIVLEGLRGEGSIAAPCRREGIAEGLCHAWSKGFLGSAHCAERQAPAGRPATPRGPPPPRARPRRCGRRPAAGRADGTAVDGAGQALEPRLPKGGPNGAGDDRG
jgi:transposase-like protein